MRKILFLGALGVASTVLMLAAPSASQAQTGCGYGGYAGPGYYPHSGYAGGGYGPTYSAGYGSYYSPGFYGRPVIEHPTYAHWTPFRGYHEHGHTHVPHRGHYHTYRY